MCTCKVTPVRKSKIQKIVVIQNVVVVCYNEYMRKAFNADRYKYIFIDTIYVSMLYKMLLWTVINIT